MSWKKIKKTVKRVLTPGHGTRKQFKSMRKKLGLTSRNRLVRSLRRMFDSRGSSQVLSGAPTSATTYQGRSVSQLMGGV